MIFVSATPAQYELEHSEGVIVEQVIRPTGLLDPEIEVRPLNTQVDDLLDEIRIRTKLNQRVLVTTLTKKMSEDLTTYLGKVEVKARYLHSDIKTMERSTIIRDFRLGEFDVLIGINLLREGMDMPEVSLVAILDADKAGFLRSATALIQTAGRAARNIDGKVIFYADNITPAMKETIDETNRRRIKQIKYNKDNNITPVTILKNIDEIMQSTSIAEGYIANTKTKKTIKKLSPKDEFAKYLDLDTPEKVIQLLEDEMRQAAEKLNFEKAAREGRKEK